MNYDDTVTAVLDNPGTQFGTRIAWDVTPYSDTPYIGAVSGHLFLYSGGGQSPYTPSQQDQGATDWYHGPDKPPTKPS